MPLIIAIFHPFKLFYRISSGHFQYSQLFSLECHQQMLSTRKASTLCWASLKKVYHNKMRETTQTTARGEGTSSHYPWPTINQDHSASSELKQEVLKHKKNYPIGSIVNSSGKLTLLMSTSIAPWGKKDTKLRLQNWLALNVRLSYAIFLFYATLKWKHFYWQDEAPGQFQHSVDLRF